MDAQKEDLKVEINVDDVDKGEVVQTTVTNDEQVDKNEA